MKSKFKQSEWKNFRIVSDWINSDKGKKEYNTVIKKYKGKKLSLNIKELIKDRPFMLSFNYLLSHKDLKKINIDSEFAKKIGYTSKKFNKNISLLVLLKNNILILLIESKKIRRGYFTDLIKGILNCGYDFTIHEPFPNMINWAKNKEIKINSKILKCTVIMNPDNSVRSIANSENKMANDVIKDMKKYGMLKK